MNDRKCETTTCATQISGRHVRFCDPCRAARRGRERKYVFNDRIDDAIRKIYAEHLGKRTRPGLTALAHGLGWPKWAVMRRGIALGLARTREQTWSTVELALLERIAWMSPQRISLKMRANNFSRSPVACALKVKRMRFKQDTTYYTAAGLASAFGADRHKILKWLKSGELYATHRGHQPCENKGDTWLIHEKDVRRFIANNPMAFDLRKVDQTWFMDLMLRKTA